jgi:hypothetical protein
MARAEPKQKEINAKRPLVTLPAWNGFLGSETGRSDWEQLAIVTWAGGKALEVGSRNPIRK